MRELPSVPINELIRTSIGSTVVGIVLLVFATLLFGVPSQSQEVAGGEAAVAVGASEQPGSESQPAESAVEPGAESGPAAGTGDATTSETVASGEGTQESGTGQ
ncbi:MAG: hypothetical protein HW403_1141, partial [Dehalococcoidia bacterium]|nr:hypothetical protein [Dehalococcoidia bacterium]